MADTATNYVLASPGGAAPVVRPIVPAPQPTTPPAMGPPLARPTSAPSAASSPIPGPSPRPPQTRPAAQPTTAGGAVSPNAFFNPHHSLPDSIARHPAIVAVSATAFAPAGSAPAAPTPTAAPAIPPTPRAILTPVSVPPPSPTSSIPPPTTPTSPPLSPSDPSTTTTTTAATADDGITAPPALSLITGGSIASSSVPSSSPSTTASSSAQHYLDITDYLNLPQSDAAKKLSIPSSTLSKRWKEAVRQRKWPWRAVCKIDKEIMTLLHNIPTEGGIMAPDIEARLAYLLRKRQEELRPVVIRL